MNDDMTARMTGIPEPTPPATIAAIVMARIAHEADRQRAAADEAATSTRRRERPVWLWSLAGLIVVLSANAYGWFLAGSMPDFTSARIGRGGLAWAPMGGPIALVIALGLLIYLAGLLAPLRSDRK